MLTGHILQQQEVLDGGRLCSRSRIGRTYTIAETNLRTVGDGILLGVPSLSLGRCDMHGGIGEV